MIDPASRSSQLKLAALTSEAAPACVRAENGGCGQRTREAASRRAPCGAREDAANPSREVRRASASLEASPPPSRRRACEVVGSRLLPPPAAPSQSISRNLGRSRGRAAPSRSISRNLGRIRGRAAPSRSISRNLGRSRGRAAPSRSISRHLGRSRGRAAPSGGGDGGGSARGGGNGGKNNMHNSVVYFRNSCNSFLNCFLFSNRLPFVCGSLS